MAEYGGLIEYLLGIRRRNGARLVRFGAFVARIPQFPPNFSITLTTTPRFGAYAMIQYTGAVSPHMIPNTFWVEVYQMGIEIQGVFLSAMAQGIHNFWVEVTHAAPIVTTLTNTTPLMHYCEFGNSFILMDTEQDYKEVGELIDEWGSTHGPVVGGRR